MARTPGQRGRVGNWLVESRTARGWSTQQRARSEIERLTGWRIPQSVYAEWESGRRLPSEANLERLEEFYGATAGEAVQTDAVAAAIDRQTAAVLAAIREQGEAQAKALAEQGKAQAEAMHELAEALLALAGPRAGTPEQSRDGRPGGSPARPVARP